MFLRKVLLYCSSGTVVLFGIFGGCHPWNVLSSIFFCNFIVELKVWGEQLKELLF